MAGQGASGERTLFLTSAWAFPTETALLFAGSLAVALDGTTEFAVLAAIFGAVLLLSLTLLSAGGGESVNYSTEMDDFYDDFWK